MRAGLCVTLGAILAGSALSACVRHEPYPSYAAVPAYHYYDPYPRYYDYGPYYGPRAHSGFSVVIGNGHRHRHHHHHRGHFHRHRW